MATKQLTATVRLNTKQAERSIDNLVKKINKIDNTVNKIGNNNRVEQKLNRSQSKLQNIIGKVNSWSKAHKSVEDSAKRINSQYKKSGSLLGMLGGKLKNLIDTYLGVMGMGAIVNTSDMITSAENKLNYVSAQQLGNAGYTTDASGNEVYSTATFQATQDAMDKMYASSQKVRMGYGDMMTNVSKSMALAGDAFDNNTDKAIRFQEIMAEAYAVGGASAAEMSSSMYQLIQALGAGTLAGDELRSVREGAPLAYKAIEEFAQKTLDTTDSLKELGSQGKITADMVTAAMLDAGEAMDKAFAQTEVTFSQVWTQIKNAAIYAFKPISKMLRESLNDAVNNGLIQKVETAFANIAKAIMISFQIISNAIRWVADNWNWLQYIVIFGLSVMALWFGHLAVVAIQSAITIVTNWLAVNGSLLMTIVVIAAIVVALVYLAKTSQNLCEFLINLAIIVATAIIGVLIMVAIYSALTGVVILTTTQIVALFIIGAILVLIAAFLQFTGEIVGGAYGIASVFKAVCHNIGVFFNNLWYGAAEAFWCFIGDILNGLASLEPAFNALAELFGLGGVTLSGLTQGAYNQSADARGKMKSYEDISGAWKTGYNEGYAIGEGIQDKINGFGDKIKNLGGDNLLDSLGEKLGLDFSSLGNFPSATDPNYDLSGLGTDPSKSLGNIDDNTSKMADSMDLTSEDVEYLRKIAALEWRKEYTIADIKVDMSNYNTINNDNDLDGIITKLTDKLYEELHEVADGVYAY